MTRVAALLCLLASPSLAGGLADTATAPDPCPPGLVADGTLTGDMLSSWQAVRAMSCPHQEPPRRAFFDARTGERLSDDEILRRVFDGSAPVTPVPVPASGLLLVAALSMLSLKRRT